RSEKREARSEKREARSEKREARSEKILEGWRMFVNPFCFSGFGIRDSGFGIRLYFIFLGTSPVVKGTDLDSVSEAFPHLEA
ncbi:hypothetical protein KIT90_27100, partial [Vibrio sp. B172a]|uniref:hypothetical protein n=1 Tax=Vibrio sp. B172a TaxID=2835790 RepID=UPI002553DB23